MRFAKVATLICHGPHSGSHDMEYFVTLFAKAPDGTRIAYEVVGEGKPIVLAHGFASDHAQNWKNVGWYETLTGAGFRVVALDFRGHGLSDKPHDDAAYGDKM